ncbi:MAG: hypothetical protein AB1393_02405 [Candidatus Edwardsbacteria bacterium]
MRVYKRGKIWYIDYTYKGKRIRERIGQSKNVAELTLKDIEVKIAKDEHLGIHEEKKILFKDFAQKYLEFSSISKSPGQYSCEKIFLLRSLERFHNKYLSEITEE